MERRGLAVSLGTGIGGERAVEAGRDSKAGVSKRPVHPTQRSGKVVDWLQRRREPFESPRCSGGSPCRPLQRPRRARGNGPTHRFAQPQRTPLSRFFQAADPRTSRRVERCARAHLSPVSSPFFPTPPHPVPPSTSPFRVRFPFAGRCASKGSRTRLGSVVTSGPGGTCLNKDRVRDQCLSVSPRTRGEINRAGLIERTILSTHQGQ